MNRKLLEHLFRNQFNLENRIENLKCNQNFSSEEAAEENNQDLFSARQKLIFVKETLDILFDD